MNASVDDQDLDDEVKFLHDLSNKVVVLLSSAERSQKFLESGETEKLREKLEKLLQKSQEVSNMLKNRKSYIVNKKSQNS